MASRVNMEDRRKELVTLMSVRMTTFVAPFSDKGLIACNP